jgi:uncharacterized protein (TIGR03435 family)
MNRRALIVLLTVSNLAAAQAPDARPLPQFEVATIKRSAPVVDGRWTVTMGGDPGRIDYQGLPLKILLSRAFNLKDDQISGPDWLDTERFDVTAKIPPSVSRDQVPAMLQALLVERFKIAFHHDKKEMGNYALVVSKNGLKLKEVAQPAGAGRLFVRNGHVETQGSLASFADLISRLAARPVFDMTGLKASYDIHLEWTPEPGQGSLFKGFPSPPSQPSAEGANPERTGPSLFTAIQEQLGLKLESRKAPVDIVVIDQIQKVPAEN